MGLGMVVIVPPGSGPDTVSMACRPRLQRQHRRQARTWHRPVRVAPGARLSGPRTADGAGQLTAFRQSSGFVQVVPKPRPRFSTVHPQRGKTSLFDLFERFCEPRHGARCARALTPPAARKAPVAGRNCCLRRGGGAAPSACAMARVIASTSAGEGARARSLSRTSTRSPRPRAAVTGTRSQAPVTGLGHRGMLPCLRAGTSWRLPASISRPWRSTWRVEAGSMTSSM